MLLITCLTRFLLVPTLKMPTVWSPCSSKYLKRNKIYVVVVYHVTSVASGNGGWRNVDLFSTHCREYLLYTMQTRLIRCCLPCNHCSIWHGLLKKFWLLVIGYVLRNARSSITWNYADPLTSLLLNIFTYTNYSNQIIYILIKYVAIKAK